MSVTRDEQGRWHGLTQAAALIYHVSHGDRGKATDVYDAEAKTGGLFELIQGLASLACDLGIGAVDYAHDEPTKHPVTFDLLLAMAIEQAEATIKECEDFDAIADNYQGGIE